MASLVSSTEEGAREPVHCTDTSPTALSGPLNDAAVAAGPKEINKGGRWTTFKRLFRFAQPEHLRIGVGLLSLSVNSITNLFFPWMMGSALDEASASTFDLYGHITKSLGIISIGSLASLVRVYCLGTSAKMLQGRMRKQVFDGYIERDLHFFDSSGIGEIVTVVESDVDSAAGAVTEKLAAGLRSMNSALNGSILLFRSSPQLCTVALSATPVVGVLSMYATLLAIISAYVSQQLHALNFHLNNVSFLVLSRYLSKKTKKIAERLRILQAAALSFAIERFGNVSTVRLNSQEETEKARFSAYMDECYDLSRSNFFSEGMFMGFINLSTNFSLVLILIAGGRLIAKGQLTAGTLTRFAIQSAFVGLGFSGLSSFYSDMTKSLDAASRHVEITIRCLS
jgi:ABC-type multidrug transport system fused ATPase/permease subunit